MRRAERQTVCINHRQKHVSSNVCLLILKQKCISAARPCFSKHFRTKMGHTHAYMSTHKLEGSFPQWEEPSEK